MPFRQNRVPHYQRMWQTNDGKPIWMKGPRAKMMLYPYYVSFWLTFAGTTYMMFRLVFGHKTWFGKD